MSTAPGKRFYTGPPRRRPALALHTLGRIVLAAGYADGRTLRRIDAPRRRARTSLADCARRDF